MTTINAPSFVGRAVVVTIADRRVAFAAGDVVEIAEISGFTPLPCEEPAHLGVALYRDRIVPVVNLARRLDRAFTVLPLAAGATCVIVRTRSGDVAFPVDGVVGVRAYGSDIAGDITLLDPDRLVSEHGENRRR
jgi:chemotaxis signal transduction protein